ncbi:carboxypeptidase-like regulatory domain-containing protein [Catellatospora sp. NPDC049609]|uniref:MSCRAMM family protein n=1 Tax=Catellatospora sp. NPDC049609 TaxID=3155505 RepID=UPI0034471ACB
MRRGAVAALAVLAAAVTIPSPAQGAPVPVASAPQRVAETDVSHISGRITDAATGAPIAGACVTAFSSSQQTLGRVCADADGRYRMDGAHGSGILLRATADTHTAWWPHAQDPVHASPVSAGPGWAPVADFAIERRRGTFRGTLTRQDGGPAIFAIATLYPVGTDQPTAFTTAYDGTFRRELPVGRYHVAFSGSGYATQWHPAAADRADALPVEITEGGTVEVRERFRAVEPIPAHPLVTVHGAVTSAADGAPVADAQVNLYDQWLDPVAAVRTDNEGRFAFPNIPQDALIEVKPDGVLRSRP